MFVDIFERDSLGRMGQRTQRRGKHLNYVSGVRLPRRECPRWAFPGRRPERAGSRE